MTIITAAQILAKMERHVSILKPITTAIVLKDGKEKIVAKADFSAIVRLVMTVSVIIKYIILSS